MPRGARLESQDGVGPGAVALAPVELLVLQGTPFCNIDCRYCYLPERANRSRMSFDTLRAACRRLVEARLVADSIDVLWHAGEPLALPVDFYETAFGVIEQELEGFGVRHKVQTNAVRINESWIALFRRWKVVVGISLDGPPAMHDRYRVTRAGAGTGDAVLAGARMLKEAGLGLSLFCVLTADSIDKPDQLFAFFESIGVDDIAFNIDEAIGARGPSAWAVADQTPGFRTFVRRYLELVVSHRSSQRVRELRSGLRSVFQAGHANAEIAPVRILTVAHDGSFTTFSPELLGVTHPEFGPLSFGNVHAEGVLEALSSHPRFLQVLASIRRGVTACAQSCGYFEVCQGGSPAAKLGEHGTFEATETVSCRCYKQAAADAVVEMLLSGGLPPYAQPSAAPAGIER